VPVALIVCEDSGAVPLAEKFSLISCIFAMLMESDHFVSLVEVDRKQIVAKVPYLKANRPAIVYLSNQEKKFLFLSFIHFVANNILLGGFVGRKRQDAGMMET